MMTNELKTIVVSVEFQDRKQESLARAEVHIEVENIYAVRAGKLIDACQRAVAQCIDVLKKNLTIE